MNAALIKIFAISNLKRVFTASVKAGNMNGQ
jgi:hypothetical protein